ncbi:MAG: glutamate racemase [Candidatus Omnitrophica bacterium]|nr:glutamate racemase [Candidatus Omnitrophota bacterium]
MNRPIGIFDSGLGGLTVVKSLRKELPDQSVCYFGDTARVPYGTKSASTILKFSRENTRFLISQDVKMIVVACHTASSLALEALISETDLPVVGVVKPGARKAVEITRNGRIGVMGTKSTISSGSYNEVIRTMDRKCEVKGIACPLLVPLIEEGWEDPSVLNRVLDHYLQPFQSGEYDTVIMGCTHYPILESVIRSRLPESVQIVNAADETAIDISHLLGSEDVVAADPVIRYFVSDEPAQFSKNGERFLGASLPSVQLISPEYIEKV